MEEMEAAKRTWWLAVVVAVVCLRASVAAQNIGTNVNDGKPGLSTDKTAFFS